MVRPKKKKIDGGIRDVDKVACDRGLPVECYLVKADSAGEERKEQSTSTRRASRAVSIYRWVVSPGVLGKGDQLGCGLQHC